MNNIPSTVLKSLQNHIDDFVVETPHFIKTLCKQKVETFFLSTLIALKPKWVPRLNKDQKNKKKSTRY